MPRPEKTSCQPEQFPSLLACQILPSSDQCHTVIQILNEYLQELHRSTPHSFCLKTSQSSPLLDFQSQASSEVARCTSIQKRASSIYCTPHEFGSMNTPLVLTGSSQSPSDSVPTQASVLASDSKERRKLYCPHSGKVVVCFYSLISFSAFMMDNLTIVINAQTMQATMH